MFVPQPPRRPTQPQQPSPSGSNRFQPNFQPDFMHTRPQQPTTTTPAPMSNFDLARRQLANPYENHGRLTELQRTQLAWEKRTNPLGIQADIQNRARIYGADAAQPLAPQPIRRPINYNRREF